MEEKEITELMFNWTEEYEHIVRLGKVYRENNKKVKEIVEYKDDSGKYSYDIIFEDGTEIKVFNPNMVTRVEPLKQSLTLIPTI